MLVSRVFSRISRSGVINFRSFVSSRHKLLPNLSNNSHSLPESAGSFSKITQPLHYSVLEKANLQQFGFSSSASPQPTDKETSQFPDEQGNVVDEKTSESIKKSEDDKASDQTEELSSSSDPKLSNSQSLRKKRRSTKRTAFSDSDTESDLSFDDLVKLVAEKEELLKAKHKEVEKMQDKVLRSYAEMENVMDRTKREAENSKKFAIQNFAKSLLDVADNLGRASSVVKDSFSKIDQSKDSAGAVPLLKTLLEGVEMTDKQLAEVFRKFGVEKFDPINEHFDPHRHQAVFEVPDASKPSGTVAAVLKPGYMLYDRVIRPADVGVTRSDEADQSSDA
ncbi:grpE protein homolog 2, mitochondrial-like isoform X1 [Tasmannia lanceolata]|uniref:grpE protein homolog 2, mitochondrial-like isoform X1 n=1 Tax=Tasmannia lanceolata TaxID=3420 RepID=UPI004064876F